jgi:hypothetical protein
VVEESFVFGRLAASAAFAVDIPVAVDVVVGYAVGREGVFAEFGRVGTEVVRDGDVSEAGVVLGEASFDRVAVVVVGLPLPGREEPVDGSFASPFEAACLVVGDVVLAVAFDGDTFHVEESVLVGRHGRF